MQSNTPTRPTPAQRKLVEMISKVEFGHIERFPVRNGEPVLDPVPAIRTCDKIGTPPKGACSPFNAGGLHPHFVDTLRRIERLGDGTVEMIEIRHGLPFLMWTSKAQLG